MGLTPSSRRVVGPIMTHRAELGPLAILEKFRNKVRHLLSYRKALPLESRDQPDIRTPFVAPPGAVIMIITVCNTFFHALDDANAKNLPTRCVKLPGSKPSSN